MWLWLLYVLLFPSFSHLRQWVPLICTYPIGVCMWSYYHVFSPLNSPLGNHQILQKVSNASPYQLAILWCVCMCMFIMCCCFLFPPTSVCESYYPNEVCSNGDLANGCHVFSCIIKCWKCMEHNRTCVVFVVAYVWVVGFSFCDLRWWVLVFHMHSPKMHVVCWSSLLHVSSPLTIHGTHGTQQPEVMHYRI